MQRRSVIALSIAAVVFLSGAGSVAYGVKNQMDDAKYCAAVTEGIAERGEVVHVSDGAPRVVVLGDSYSASDWLPNRADGWTYRLGAAAGWSVDVAAVGGTGYVNEGYCGDQAFSERLDKVLALSPETLIIQGGLNDSEESPEDIREAAADLLARVGSVPRVILVGPTDAPSLDNLPAVDRALSEAAKGAGREYVSALDWDLEFLPDRLHLTPAGHSLFADNVLAAVG